jgi:hypothetical protein
LLYKPDGEVNLGDETSGFGALTMEEEAEPEGEFEVHIEIDDG